MSTFDQFSYFLSAGIPRLRYHFARNDKPFLIDIFKRHGRIGLMEKWKRLSEENINAVLSVLLGGAIIISVLDGDPNIEDILKLIGLFAIAVFAVSRGFVAKRWIEKRRKDK